MNILLYRQTVFLLPSPKNTEIGRWIPAVLRMDSQKRRKEKKEKEKKKEEKRIYEKRGETISFALIVPAVFLSIFYFSFLFFLVFLQI